MKPHNPLGYWHPTIGPHADHEILAAVNGWWCATCYRELEADEIEEAKPTGSSEGKPGWTRSPARG